MATCVFSLKKRFLRYGIASCQQLTNFLPGNANFAPQTHFAMAEVQAFNLFYLIGIIRRYIWYIAALLLLTGIIAVIGTMPYFYPPEYLSHTLIYPTSPERFDVVNLFADEPRVFVYGDSKEVEKLDNLANTPDFQLAIIDSLNLWGEYGVDEGSAHPKFEALRVYNSRVNTIRVAGNGLRIEAYDTDPQRAADIANLVVREIDRRNRHMLLQNRHRIAQLYEQGMQQMRRQLAVYKDSAKMVRRQYAILHSERQTEVMLDRILQVRIRLNNEMARLKAYENSLRPGDTALLNTRARVEGLRKSLLELQSENSKASLSLPKFRDGYDEIRSLEEVYIRLAASIEATKEKLEYLRMINQAEVSTIMVVGEAQPADKKARPVRWLILAASLLVAGLVSIMGVVLVDFILRKQTAQ